MWLVISEQMDAEFHKIANEIAKNSPYQRKESEERTMMTVHEMGDLLGIKKTIVVQLSRHKFNIFIMNRYM